MGVGCVLQRLFSIFPNGWPGFGLFLLRLGMSVALMYLGALDIMGPPGETATIARDLVAATVGILVLAGLWTPLAAAFIAVDELWSAFALYSSIHVFLAVLSAALAMLGPGAWSIDARLFGRKRFDIGDRPGVRSHSHKGPQ